MSVVHVSPWWWHRGSCLCVHVTLFNMGYTSQLCPSPTDLLQLESEAALLKLSTSKHVPMGGLDWSLTMDAADMFV